jgi:hypothetical protein
MMEEEEKELQMVVDIVDLVYLLKSVLEEKLLLMMQ